MSNAARKARKKAGEPVEREPKIPTPLIKRQSFQRMSAKRQEALAKDYGVEITERQKQVLEKRRLRYRVRAINEAKGSK